MAQVSFFSFDTEACHNGHFVDGAVAFERDPVFTKCSPGLGIEAFTAAADVPLSRAAPPLMMAKNPTQHLLQSVRESNQGISFEFWLKPIGDDRSTGTIFTLGRRQDKPNRFGLTECDRYNFDMRLMEYDGKFEFWYRTTNNQDYPCEDVFPVYADVQPGKMVHLVLTLTDRDQNAYINGQPFLEDGLDKLSQPFPNSLSHWSKRSAMNFFTGSEENLWNGRLFQFAVYNRKLSREEVRAKLERGLPRSPPYSLSHQIVLTEDAEAVPGSHHQDWYTQSPILTSLNRTNAQDLQRVSLPVYSVFEEVESLLASVDLKPAFDYNDSASFVYVTGLPSKGNLYQFLDGHYVGLDHQSPPNSSAIKIEDPTNMIFVPSLNENSEEGDSEYTNFKYCVTDHNIANATHCDSAVVSVRVDSSNDPPRAVASPRFLTAIEGQPESEVTASIELGGIDVDRNDSITDIQITSQPRWGTLILRVTSFRDDGILHGAALAPWNNLTTISSQEGSIHVKYVFDRFGEAPPGYLVPGDNDASDSFSFRVSDRSGSWSLEETVHIELISAMIAGPSELPQKVHGSKPASISLSATDLSGKSRQVAYLIESVPNSSLGSLYDMQHKLVSGGSLLLTGSEGGDSSNATRLSFLAGPNVCNSTYQEQVYTSFSFRAVATADQTVTSASRVATQELDVQCESYPIRLLMSNSVLVLQGFGLGSINGTNCGNNFYESIPSVIQESCFASAPISGIKIRQAGQQHSNPVLVTLRTGKGFVTFAKASWGKVKPIQGRRQMASGEVTFAALAADLERIFAGLSFRSQSRGADVLEILTQHGNCTGFNHQNTTIAESSSDFDTSRCYRASLTIQVLVEGSDSDPVYKTSAKDFPIGMLTAWLGVPALYFFLWLCWCGYSSSGLSLEALEDENGPFVKQKIAATFVGPAANITEPSHKYVNEEAREKRSTPAEDSLPEQVVVVGVGSL